MKVIVDTNVLVSAAIAGKNPGIVLVFIADSPQVEWMVSAEILTEYREVLNRPKLKLTEAEKQRWFDIIEEATTLIDVNIEVDFSRDSKDAKFIACALASGADFFNYWRSRFYGGRRLGKNQGYFRFAI